MGGLGFVPEMAYFETPFPQLLPHRYPVANLLPQSVRWAWYHICGYEHGRTNRPPLQRAGKSRALKRRRGANAHSLANFFLAALVIESKRRKVPSAVGKGK